MKQGSFKIAKPACGCINGWLGELSEIGLNRAYLVFMVTWFWQIYRRRLHVKKVMVSYSAVLGYGALVLS